MNTSATRTSILKSFLPLTRRPHRLERMLVAAANRLQYGKLTVKLPSGNSHSLSGSRDEIDGQQFHATWDLKSYRAIQRILQTQSVGFAEGYIEGEWDSPDLGHLLELIACNMDAMEAAIDRWGIVRVWNQVQHVLRSNTKGGSRRNISYHYDLGNDFYQQWLDPSMTYSSGLFDEHHHDLESAQLNKYRHLAEELQLEPGQRILEIGCGWGGFAEFAASHYGCKVVCLTLSEEQLNYARQRIEDAGLADQVELRLQDYRDVNGQFDRIVSIEMFEAVGEQYWTTYFDQVRALLKPGGRAGLQIITIANERFEGYRNQADFIQKYVFPGGMLPSPEKLYEHFEEAGLSKTGELEFGMSYARTLQAWRDAFLKNWDAIEKLGYSNRFRRMWEYYLCYCEAGFRRQTINVGHYFLQKTRND